MIQIRPVSNLRNKFPEIEKYSELTNDIEIKLDEAEQEAESTNIRYTHEEVMESVRKKIHGK